MSAGMALRMRKFSWLIVNPVAGPGRPQRATVPTLRLQARSRMTASPQSKEGETSHMLDVLIHRLRLGAVGVAAVALAAGLTGAAQAQTLVTWDDYTDVGQNAVIEQLNKNFAAAHSGVTISRTARSFDALSMTLRLTVAAGNGPQVTKVNQGAAGRGAGGGRGRRRPGDD